MSIDFLPTDCHFQSTDIAGHFFAELSLPCGSTFVNYVSYFLWFEEVGGLQAYIIVMLWHRAVMVMMTMLCLCAFFSTHNHLHPMANRGNQRPTYSQDRACRELWQWLHENWVSPRYMNDRGSSSTIHVALPAPGDQSNHRRGPFPFNTQDGQDCPKLHCAGSCTWPMKKAPRPDAHGSKTCAKNQGLCAYALSSSSRRAPNRAAPACPPTVVNLSLPPSANYAQGAGASNLLPPCKPALCPSPSNPNPPRAAPLWNGAAKLG